jgi:hypothetical protein
MSSSKINLPVAVRPLQEADLEAADRVMRLAFGTFLGLPDPSAAFCAEAEGVVVGSVYAAYGVVYVSDEPEACGVIPEIRVLAEVFDDRD